jgi:hypothetical protein
MAEKMAAKLGTIWQLHQGEDYPEGEDGKAVSRFASWARKNDLKCRTSIPGPGIVEVRFTRLSEEQGDA